MDNSEDHTGSCRSSSGDSSATRNLDELVYQLAPELVDAPRGEARATCANCAMTPARPAGQSHPWDFSSRTRCCTFQPRLPNYVVGALLRDGGGGAALMRQRLGRGQELTAWGVLPEPGRLLEGAAVATDFGRDEAFVCAYWIGGDHSCGIWSRRNAVCRTWFCKHDDGIAGAQRWLGLERLLTWIEDHLADLCCAAGVAPQPPASAGEWERWYRWCAQHVRDLDPAEALADSSDRDELDNLRACYNTSLALPSATLPDVVVPAVTSSLVRGREVTLAGYSNYDAVVTTPAVLEFFSLLDGSRTWRQALARLASPGAIGESVVREMFRVGLLGAPEKNDEGVPPPNAAIPDLLVPAMERPISVGGSVWLQGSIHQPSILAPMAIFEVIALLDGKTPWRDALDRVSPVAGAELDAELIRRLFLVGALRAAEC